MEKLKQEDGDKYFITKKKEFAPLPPFSEQIIDAVFNFAYAMTFGKEGEHRDHRSGGQHKRRNGEIFINAFQGKLSEFGVYYYLRKNNIIDLGRPDLDKWELGKWDDADFVCNKKKISIKSTKYFGNLILLETKDWNNEGFYLPNNAQYDLTILVRVKPDGEKLLKSQKLLYADFCKKEQLKLLIKKEKWQCDIPGFITLDALKYIINNNFILPQNSYLNGTTKMDAENYYIQAGDLININQIKNELIVKE